MVRAPCCEKMGLKKGPWTPEEDQILISYIQKNGHGNWRALPKQAGLLRCGKSCRLRWTNYLRPDIKRGNFTQEEEDTIIKLHEMLGNRWSAIAARLPGRTDNEIKNVWHTHLKKRLENYQPPQPSKRHSSNVPKSNSKVPKAPISPEQSSSSEMSSLTDTSGTNTISPARLETNQEEMNSSEYNPQIDESFWSEHSATETDSSVKESSEKKLCENNQLVNEHEEMDSSKYIRRNKIPRNEDPNMQVEIQAGINGESKFEFPSSNMECENACSSNVEDDMDFWFNVFIRAGDLPDLPEF